jgi:hypothetical protein
MNVGIINYQSKNIENYLKRILMNNILKELKPNKIYDYNNIQNYNKLLTCLYDKKEPIDFLFSKTIEDISV